MLYPNNTTKQIVSREIDRKIKLLEEANERNASEISNVGDAVNSLGERTSAAEEDIADIKGAVETINGEIDDINDALEGKQDTLEILDNVTAHSNNPVKSSGIYNALQEKIDTDKIKDNPEPNGIDVLSTGGAYDIVQDIGEQIDEIREEIAEAGVGEIDEVPTENSRALVRSGGIYDAIENAKEEVKSEVVTGVKGGAENNYRIGNVNITKDNIGLGNVNNTSDMDKPVSTAQATAISNAVTNGINALDVPEVGGNGKYVKAISETNGKISATVETMDSTPTEDSNKAVTSGGVKTALDGKQNTLTSGANIKIDNNVIEGTSDLPTDAVLHYSFDEVPDYPDGAADVRLLDNNTYDMQSSSYNFTANSSTIINNLNGKLEIKTTESISNSWFVYISPRPTNKIIIIKFTITQIDANTAISIRNGNNKVVIECNKIGTYKASFINDSISSYPTVYFYISGGLIDLVIDEIYIGNGSYSTPVIDNANGKWNSVSQSGIAVHGVSGKGVKCFSQTIRFDNFNLNSNFTISIWCKTDNNTTNLLGNILNKQAQIVLRNGSATAQYLMVFLYDENDTRVLDGARLDSLLPPNEWVHITLIREGTTFKYFKNGIKVTTLSLANETISNNNNYMLIGHASNTRPQSYDDLQIFDRALSETEVVALYNNKANTPKYFPVPVTILDDSLAVPTCKAVSDKIDEEVSNVTVELNKKLTANNITKPYAIKDTESYVHYYKLWQYTGDVSELNVLHIVGVIGDGLTAIATVDISVNLHNMEADGYVSRTGITGTCNFTLAKYRESGATEDTYTLYFRTENVSGSRMFNGYVETNLQTLYDTPSKMGAMEYYDSFVMLLSPSDKLHIGINFPSLKTDSIYPHTANGSTYIDKIIAGSISTSVFATGGNLAISSGAPASITSPGITLNDAFHGVIIPPKERISETGTVQGSVDFNWTDLVRGSIHSITGEMLLQAAISAGDTFTIDLQDITGILNENQRHDYRVVCYAVRKYYNASASVNIVQCLLHYGRIGASDSWQLTFLDAIPADGDTWEITPIIISM